MGWVRVLDEGILVNEARLLLAVRRGKEGFVLFTRFCVILGYCSLLILQWQLAKCISLSTLDSKDEPLQRYYRVTKQDIE